MSVLALALFAAGGCLLLAEAAAPGLGIAGLAGVASLVAGVAALLGDAPGPTLDWALAAPAVLLGLTALALAGRHVVRAQRRLPPTSGTGAVLGHETTVRRRAGRPPQGFVAGAWWTLRSATGAPLAEGDRAWVVDVDLDRLQLVVEPLPPNDPSSSDPEGTH